MRARRPTKRTSRLRLDTRIEESLREVARVKSSLSVLRIAMYSEVFDPSEGADLVWDLVEQLTTAHAQLDAVITAHDDRGA